MVCSSKKFECSMHPEIKTNSKKEFLKHLREVDHPAVKNHDFHGYGKPVYAVIHRTDPTNLTIFKNESDAKILLGLREAVFPSEFFLKLTYYYENPAIMYGPSISETNIECALCSLKERLVA